METKIIGYLIAFTIVPFSIGLYRWIVSKDQNRGLTYVILSLAIGIILGKRIDSNSIDTIASHWNDAIYIINIVYMTPLALFTFYASYKRYKTKTKPISLPILIWIIASLSINFSLALFTSI